VALFFGELVPTGYVQPADFEVAVKDASDLQGQPVDHVIVLATPY
jgi:hypothetical protein